MIEFYSIGPIQIKEERKKKRLPLERVLEFQTFFNVSQSWNSIFFSISNTLSTYKFQTFEGKNRKFPDFYHIRSQTSRFYLYFSCTMSGFPELFYKNLFWNSSQLSNLVLEFQTFSEIEKIPSIGGSPFLSGTAHYNTIQ